MLLDFAIEPLLDSIAHLSRPDRRVKMNEIRYVTAEKSTIGGA